MNAKQQAIIDKCAALAPMDNLKLYADFVDESPDYAVLSASALRIQARAGDVPDALIPILYLCLTQAPDLGTTVHLGKALAAFGREGQMAAPEIVRKAEAIHVTDDAYFWILDSLLFVLGYLGGESATAFLAQLSNEKPLRVNVSDSVYQGQLDAGERKEIHERTLKKVNELLSQKDAGKWSRKVTELKMGADDETAPKTMAPWMIR